MGIASLVCTVSAVVLLVLTAVLARVGVSVDVRGFLSALALAASVAAIVTGLKGRSAWTGKIGMVLALPVCFVALVFTALTFLWLRPTPTTPPAVASVVASAEVPPSDLQCTAAGCSLTYVTDTAAETLNARPDKDSLHVTFRFGATQAGFASISRLPWVTALTISSQVTDLSPVAGLKDLRSLLVLDAMKTPSFAPIAGLTNLRELNLSSAMQLPDLTPLAGLTSLTTLTVSGAPKVTDLSPLTHLTALQSLDLTGVGATDGTPLGQLHALQKLSLNRFKLASWDFLRSLTALTHLDTAGSGIPDLQAVASLHDLSFLWMTDEKVASLAPLAKLSNLKDLTLSSTSFGDAKALGTLSAVQDLSLELPHAGDVSVPAIAKLTGLVSLTLNDDPELTDIAPLASLKKLRTLVLSQDKKLTSIAALRSMPDLAVVRIEGSGVSDLTPLAGTTGLTSLDVSSTAVQSLAPLAKLTGLQMVNIQGTTIKDVSALAGDKGLRDLLVAKDFPDGALVTVQQGAPSAKILR